MAIVDQQGRVFGRLNLVDAVLVLLFLGLIPLAYGAYTLFRTPPPRLTAVEPATLPYGPNLRVTIRGENLRPYMRVSFNERQGTTFLFSNPTTAQVDLGDIPPGVYDVILYDQAQERARLPKALTIQPPALPTAQVVVVGTLANLTDAQASQIAAGTVLPGLGEILEVGQPTPEATRVNVGDGILEIPVATAVRLPMTVRMGCYVQSREGRAECVGAGVVLQPDAFLALPTPLGLLPFQIDQVRGPQPLEPIAVRVRFVGAPAALSALQSGDLDLGRAVNELAAGAIVIDAAPARRISGAVTVLSEEQVLVADDLAMREVTLRVEAQRVTSGWMYAGGSLRVGSPFVFRTPEYELQGSVVQMTPGPEGGATP